MRVRCPALGRVPEGAHPGAAVRDFAMAEPRFFGDLPVKSLLVLGLSSAVAGSGCGDDQPADDASIDTSGDGDGDPSTGDGDGDPSTGDGDPSTGDGDGDGDGDPSTGDGDGDSDPYPGIPPQLYCPGHPSGDCDEVEGAPLRVGTAVRDLVPDCFESWTDVAGNGSYNAGEDDFFDCGCDRLCPPDADYPGPERSQPQSKKSSSPAL